MEINVINLPGWIEENKKFFLPPVCNKLMHNDQLKIMFVGGPNVRKDYHIEEGEEFFYMIQGDMCLKVIEQGKPRDIVIKEGEAFLLPARIPHSPQRKANTVGLVIERERLKHETDILRYYVDGSLDVLYEKAFYCEDLGKDLPPVIQAFFKSNAHKTGIPDAENVLSKYPFELDQETILGNAACLLDLILKSTQNVDMDLFPGNNQFKVQVIRDGSHNFETDDIENWIWQISGNSAITIGNKCNKMGKGDTALLQARCSFNCTLKSESVALRISQKR